MLTSKQRALLRSKANTLTPLTQLGKEGITPSFLRQIDSALTSHELIKLHALESSGYTAREASDELCEKLTAEPVQCIGGKFVLFRKNPEKSAFDTIV